MRVKKPLNSQKRTSRLFDVIVVALISVRYWSWGRIGYECKNSKIMLNKDGYKVDRNSVTGLYTSVLQVR